MARCILMAALLLAPLAQAGEPPPPSGTTEQEQLKAVVARVQGAVVATRDARDPGRLNCAVDAEEKLIALTERKAATVQSAGEVEAAMAQCMKALDLPPPVVTCSEPTAQVEIALFPTPPPVNFSPPVR